MIAEKLNRTKGRAKVLIPTQGFSNFSRKERRLYDPGDERAFTESLKANLVPSVAVREIDAHINDAEFADAVIADFFQLLTAS